MSQIGKNEKIKLIFEKLKIKDHNIIGIKKFSNGILVFESKNKKFIIKEYSNKKCFENEKTISENIKFQENHITNNYIEFNGNIFSVQNFLEEKELNYKNIAKNLIKLHNLKIELKNSKENKKPSKIILNDEDKNKLSLKIIQEINQIKLDEDIKLIHGDFYLRNIINNHFIDFELSHYANKYIDLSSFALNLILNNQINNLIEFFDEYKKQEELNLEKLFSFIYYNIFVKFNNEPQELDKINNFMISIEEKIKSVLK